MPRFILRRQAGFGLRELVSIIGRLLASYAASAKHCAFYPGSIVQQFKKELKDYDTAKGTIRFAADKPLPSTLVRKIVKARIAQQRL